MTAPSASVVQAFERYEIPEAASSRFRLENFDLIDPGALHWLVKGLWPQCGLCFVGGPSMSGKSFWLLKQLANICRGLPVLGRKSKRAGVVYIGAEGAAGVRNRIKGLRGRIGRLEGAFQFIGQGPDLTSADDVEGLRSALEGARAEMEANGIRLGVVALDTLSASIPGVDENTARDMSPVLAALQQLAIDLGVLVVVVAHTGKDTERGLRGWSGLLANADGLVMLNPPDGTYRGGEVVKVKDGESGDKFAFELARVVIGVDEDGDEVTTCVVDEVPIQAKTAVSRKLQPVLELILKCLGACIDAGQFETVPMVDGVPRGTKGVRRDALRAKLKAEGYTSGATTPENLRKGMNRHIDALVALGRLRGDDLVWLVRP
jgi:hypothetical protein